MFKNARIRSPPQAHTDTHTHLRLDKGVEVPQAALDDAQLHGNASIAVVRALNVQKARLRGKLGVAERENGGLQCAQQFPKLVSAHTI